MRTRASFSPRHTAVFAETYGRMAPVIFPASSTTLRLHRAWFPGVRLAELVFALFAFAWLITTLVPVHATSHALTEPVATFTSVSACHSEAAGDIPLLDTRCALIPVDTHAFEHCALHCAPVHGVLVLALGASLLVVLALVLPAHVLAVRLNHPPLTPPPQLLLG
jgi:hypothetical protein